MPKNRLFDNYDPNFFFTFSFVHLVKIFLGSDNYKCPKMALKVARFSDVSRKLAGKPLLGLLNTPAS